MPEPMLDGETLRLRAHRHWILMVRWLAVPAAILVAALLLEVIAAALLPGEVRLAMLLAALALLGLWTIAGYVRWASTSLAVTDRRVLFESGVLSRVTKVVALDRVQDVTTRQPVIGRVLGYGTLEIASAGAEGPAVATHVPFPQRVRDEIFVQAARGRRPEGY